MSHFFLKIVTYRGLWGCHSPSYTQKINKINLKKQSPASFSYIFHKHLAFLLKYLQCIYVLQTKLLLIWIINT